jgi:lipoprotein NlpI
MNYNVFLVNPICLIVSISKMARKKVKKSTPKQVPKSNLPSNRNLLRSLGILLSVIAFLIYTNTLGHDYALDDASAISDNYVTKQGISGIPTIFKEHYRFGYWNSPGTLYRLIPLAMFAVEWQVAPDSPGFYHFTNVFFYALTAFLLFWTLCKVIPKYSPALPFLTTLLFITHPIHVEVVANIKSRDEILSFLFCISAVYFLWKYLKNKNNKWIAFSLFSYLLAMFSKENAITFLAIFPLLMYFFSKQSLSKNLTTSALYTIPVGIYLMARISVLGGLSGNKELSPLLDNFLSGAPDLSTRLASAFLMIGKYLMTLVFPHPLGSDFGYNQIPLTEWSDWRVILVVLAVAGILIYAFKGLKNKSLPSFSILYFLITFSIFSNILILIGSSFGDRFMYFPSLGFAMVLAFLILQLSKVDFNLKPHSMSTFFNNYKMPLLIAGAVAVTYSFKTIDRNSVWSDSFSLYENDIKIAPNSAKLNYHFGLELNKKGLDENDPKRKGEFMNKAFQHFAKAAEIFPDYHDAYGQMGLMHYRNKSYDRAMNNYEKSLSLKQNNATVYSNMGIIYFEQGNLQKAREVYEKAIQIDPRFVDARRNLGSVYAQQKQFDKAIEQFNEALNYEPDNAVIYLYLGYAHRDKGDAAGAQTYFNKAYEMDPSLKK